MIPNDAVWSGFIDDGRWEVWVERTGEYDGVLNVRDAFTQKIILTQPVTLAYGARFGPDYDDVAEWQNLAIIAADREKRGGA